MASLRLRLGLLVSLLLFGVVYTWGIYAYFTSRDTGGNDFFSRYVAWRAFILEGRNPYSDEVTHEIQLQIEGRLARPGEDENALIYPWYAVLVQWPFVFLPWPWARAVYMVLCQLFIVVGLALTARLLRWRLSPPLLACTAVWAILLYPEARGVLLGQIVVTQYLFGVLALWLLHQNRPLGAGICLALTTVRPTAIFLFVPFLLLYALVRRRRRLVWGFGLALAALVFAGFLFLPNWFGDWLYRVSRYPQYTVGQSPVWLLAHQATTLGDAGEWLLTLLCLALMGVAWWHVLRQKDDAAFHWGLGVTWVVSDLVAYRSATTNYIFLLFPTYLIFAALVRTWPRLGSWVVVVVQVIGLVGLWWLFAVTVQGDQEQAIMYLPQPIIIGLVLLVGRQWLITDNRRAGVVV